MLPLATMAEPVPAAESLRDRVILVTGATGGLGRASALACARAGASVILLGRRVRAIETVYDELGAAGASEPAIYPMNLEGATPENYTELADILAREYGRLDGIVHAAAQFDGMPLLREAPDAAIVFVLDDPERTGKSFWGGYGAAKHGLAGLAEIVHEETERTKVRTHMLLPSPMRTPLRRMAYFGEDTMMHPTPDAAGAAVAWLLSADALALRGTILDLRRPTETQR